MPNSLTRSASLKLGPLFLETLVKHYFDRIKKDASKSGIALRKDELLYDEAFSIVKDFLEAATKHTVEELQSFSNTRTPSPPWVHVIRLVVPMSCCDDAATHLIKAFGGEEVMKKTVGGTKWWQVRGIRGVHAEWITAKKDWQEAQRRQKSSSSSRRDTGLSVNFGSAFTAGSGATTPLKGDVQPSPAENSDNVKKEAKTEAHTASGGAAKEGLEDSGAYQPEMDEMRCILYSHGGGYYFGSVDQERYSIQRYARKIHGRVLAVNYRLAPQYPFPCAIQDLLAAYLFLIRPPEGATHRPVKPSHIVIAGDSAGGGLSLALLQIIRDSGLPLPAGGVLISPWCDFTHSFPSIFTNTDTDVIPSTGLVLHKPSSLWPPPPDEMTSHVRDRLRKSIREVLRPGPRPHGGESSSDPNLLRPPPLTSSSSRSVNVNVKPKFLPTEQGPMAVGSTASLPPPGSLADQPVVLETPNGERIEIAQQIQLYAPNGLLKHPLVSPALSYLGGLPPLFFIASDKEVLRDEIIYAAHRAAYPERFPIREDIKKMYPLFEGLEDRIKPTPVHLQVYDDAAHVLPVLFAFTTPAKYCYRAIASFCKHVTNMNPAPQSPIDPDIPAVTYSPASMSPLNEDTPNFPASNSHSLAAMNGSSSTSISATSSHSGTSPSHSRAQSTTPDKRVTARSTSFQLQHPPRKRHSISHGLSSAASSLRRHSSAFVRSSAPVTRAVSPNTQNGPTKESSGDVAGPRFGDPSLPHPKEEVLAGNPVVYNDTWAKVALHQGMIRERISTQGVVRPLESEDELPALQVPPEIIGTLSERAINRYLTGQQKFDRKFAPTIRSIAKHRRRNLEVASKDMFHHISQLQHYLDRSPAPTVSEPFGEGSHTLRQGLLGATPSWSLAWALDADERPPPSSIVSRRDTEEAIKLARVADQAILASESALNANNLWSVVVNFLTVAPDRQDKGKAGGPGKEKRKRRSKFVAFWRSKLGAGGRKSKSEGESAEE
ncbi:alpha/beta-hydrolase [Artomyces pyxidatus]|uniref:Alpha/beta-hydrolase n=1 Tax=Artomyces pyxidatus TaxID=48021 RepID=A0ACB8TGV4_9AGAM|nr:alpha/beta-hydrolase [Artomyces pyxidatus]